jgi:hypothetical protein
MKKLFRFYNILRLTAPTRKGLVFLIVNGIILTVIYNRFFTDSGVYQVDFVVLFGLSVLVVSYYAYIAHSTADNPIYQLPWTAKERVLYTYLNVIFVFFSILIGLILFGYLMMGLFVLLGDGLDSGNDVSVSLRSSLYLIGNSTLFFAIYMPTSFYKNIKRRYVHSFIAWITLILVNFIVVFILSGGLSLSSSLLIQLNHSSSGLGIAIGMLIVSILALYGSYDASKRLVKYK